jgi:hypothetical protein
MDSVTGIIIVGLIIVGLIALVIAFRAGHNLITLNRVDRDMRECGDDLVCITQALYRHGHGDIAEHCFNQIMSSYDPSKVEPHPSMDTIVNFLTEIEQTKKN